MTLNKANFQRIYLVDDWLLIGLTTQWIWFGTSLDGMLTFHFPNSTYGMPKDVVLASSRQLLFIIYQKGIESFSFSISITAETVTTTGETTTEVFTDAVTTESETIGIQRHSKSVFKISKLVI